MQSIIADNHRLFLDGLCSILDNMSLFTAFHKAGSGDELTEFCKTSDDIGLIMADFYMPGWSGIDLIRHIRQWLPKEPLIVVSASEDYKDIQQAIKEGASGFIPKTSSIPVLVGAIKLVLAGGIYLPPEILLADQCEIANATKIDKIKYEITLTTRQMEILCYLKAGKSNRQIASEIGISEGTLKTHLTILFKRLGVSSRTQAVIAAMKLVKAP
jgi:DNA-binding NarL/FixJ family response regulator